jgi:hypothetical protein
MEKKFLLLFVGGVLGVMLGKLLEKDRRTTEEYLTNTDIPR